MRVEACFIMGGAKNDDVQSLTARLDHVIASGSGSDFAVSEQFYSSIFPQAPFKCEFLKGSCSGFRAWIEFEKYGEFGYQILDYVYVV